eukprot:UN17212
MNQLLGTIDVIFKPTPKTFLQLKMSPLVLSSHLHPLHF